jgi:isoleucyl-tRNA synthetase
VLLPIWNAYSFFTLYANVDGHRAEFRTDATGLLDRYLLAKTRAMVEAVTERMDDYDLPGATAELQGFIDALNNWYIRRSRDRFWAKASAANEADKRDAHDTLYTVLVTFARTAAPFLPMVMEEVHGGLTGGDSVHLSDWPDPAELPADPDLVARMDRLRDVASTALRLREDHGLRVRLPLASLTVAGADAESLADLVHLLVDEVNVKSVEMTDDLEAHATFRLQPDGRVLGPRLGGGVQAVFAAARAGEFTHNDDGTVGVAGETLQPDEFVLALESPEGVTAAALGSGDGVVVLDIEVTPELESEGLARDVVRHVQQARRDAGLVVTDRILLWLDGDAALLDAVRAHEAHVAGQVLAAEVAYGPSVDAIHTAGVAVEGHALTLAITRA